MYPPCLTSMLTSKRTTLINLESFTKKSIDQLLRDFTPPDLSLFMEVILASSTPITEEHTKLLDCLSELLSQLIHRISHPPEEDVLAEVVTACFICVRDHGFASCIPTFCKNNYSPLQTMHWHITAPSFKRRFWPFHSCPLT